MQFRAERCLTLMPRAGMAFRRGPSFQAVVIIGVLLAFLLQAAVLDQHAEITFGYVSSSGDSEANIGLGFVRVQELMKESFWSLHMQIPQSPYREHMDGIAALLACPPPGLASRPGCRQQQGAQLSCQARDSSTAPSQQLLLLQS